ncbi:unnamed protein product [Mytilus coruscus]|uniref:Uncharacterized protein n=1 Tax=Mytilus coruscus TaxID=42192 RepID=A0A6J8CW13_MYTCO|nr:unnamed protein product [Mytilus coruscus]
MDDSVNQGKSILALEVTEEQKETIYNLFAHHNWDYKEIEIKENKDENKETNGAGNSEDFDDFLIEQNDNFEECPYCLCKPCITHEHNRQMWWESEIQMAHIRNSSLRKTDYKRFWTNLFHRNVWQDPRYLERKRAALRQDPRRRNYVYHRRDLMPKCVIELVRSWFPNLPNVPYMGHMWE